MLAQTALGSNPKAHCPDLRIADEGTIAAVIFLVGRSGVPSKASVRAPSGSAALDAAALSCVLKLRFAPAVQPGGGEPFEAWQQIAFRWAERGTQDDARSTTAHVAPGASASVDPPVSAGTSTAAGVGVRREDAYSQRGETTVRVCVDGEGKPGQKPFVVRSSGDTLLDEAAVKIAAAGSENYHPGTTTDGKAVSRCIQMAIRFEGGQQQ
jgi:TonB family protein